MDFDSLRDDFSNAGFNLVGTLPAISLTPEEQQTLTKSIPQYKTGSLLLVAAGGKGLWHKSADWRAEHPAEPDKFNRYSLEKAKAILSTHEIGYTALYPSAVHSIGLVNCGKQLGWHGESALGLGINPKFGLWYAYRLLLWIDQPAATQGQMDVIDYCTACVDKPCLSACPVNAVSKQGMEKLQHCSKHRVLDNSSCADRCFSRLACPVASEHIYEEPQIQYHYRANLQFLKDWYAKQT